MPLYMDVHRDLDGLTSASFLVAHERALAHQEEAGVRYRHHWYDDRSGTAFCLVEAATVAAVIAAHRRAHGLVPDEVVRVHEAPRLPQDAQSGTSP